MPGDVWCGAQRQVSEARPAFRWGACSRGRCPLSGYGICGNISLAIVKQPLARLHNGFVPRSLIPSTVL